MIPRLLPKQRALMLRDDEYRNDEGIIFCKACHTPRQATVAIEGEVYTSRVMCRCQKECYEREEAEEKARRQRQQIERNRSVGLPDPVLQAHTFENDLGYNPKAIEYARNYAEKFDAFCKEGLGLLLWGDVGTGKSFIAGCIANDLLNKNVRVLMTNFSRLLNRLTDLQMGDRNGYINSLNSFDLLIIDDLGIERNSEFAKEQAFSIIDSRYRSGKPLIVTTNLGLHEMDNASDLWRRRIFDRVRERCIPVKVSSQNIRKILAEKTIERGKELLTHGNG
ncbi:MAG: AAA family ATPase [Ruminococcaceae bacterium]|nr:AAA family ATPase [Oscillospiraceae bacterium]